jgi:Tfp pilus assembly protein PilV
MIIKSGKFAFIFSKLKNGYNNAYGYSLIELVMVILLFSASMPAIVSMYTSVLTNSHSAEYLTIAELLAVEQMEIILAHKAGTGGSYGYGTITSARYSSVNPPAPFSAWTRSVSIQTVNSGGAYEYKLITVTVDHDLIDVITLETIIFDHLGL